MNIEWLLHIHNSNNKMDLSIDRPNGFCSGFGNYDDYINCNVHFLKGNHYFFKKRVFHHIWGGNSRKFTAICGIHYYIFWKFFPVGAGECCEILGVYSELIQNFFLAGWAVGILGLFWREFMHL